MRVNYQDVQCPLYIKRYSTKSFSSIFCKGKGEDAHCLISKSIPEREEKITNTCDNYESCKFYQTFKKSRKGRVK